MGLPEFDPKTISRQRRNQSFRRRGGIADLDRQWDGTRQRLSRYIAGVLAVQGGLPQFLAGTEPDGIGINIDSDHVSGVTQRQSQSLALADGVMVNAPVDADYITLSVPELTWPGVQLQVTVDEIAIAAVGHETQVLALCPVGHR